MKKGFTLIELLAVIVILAVIALIATPIIINIINDSREQAGIRGAELYLDAVKLAIVKANMTGEVTAETCTVLQTGNLSCGGTEIQVDMNGTTATAGTITFTNGKITSVTGLVMGDATYNTDSNGKIVKGETIAHVPFTGTIYRISDELVSIGESIVPRTESAICAYTYADDELIENSCDFYYYFNSMEECNAEIATYDEEEGITYTCEAGTVRLGLTDYQTESPATQPLIKSVNCVVFENPEYNSCVDDNSGFSLTTDCSLNGYECVQGTIQADFYLKHEVENDIIQTTYACIILEKNQLTGILKPAVEICLQGGDSSNFGTYDGMSDTTEFDLSNKNPTGNISILSSVTDYFNYYSSNYTNRKCSFNSSVAWCDGITRKIYAYESGDLWIDMFPSQPGNMGNSCHYSSAGGYSSCF